MTRRLATAWLLVALIVGFYWQLVLTGRVTWMDGPDTSRQVLPWLQFQAGEWHAGRVPLWDPNHWFGQPLIGQAQPGVVSPLNWVLFAVPLKHGWLRESALNWYFVLIHFLAAWFAYKLARELGCQRLASVAGGVIFSLAGWLGDSQWPQMLAGAIWTPLVFLYLLRVARMQRPLAASILGGFFLGVAWLSGHHQIPIFTSLAAAGTWAWIVARAPRLWRACACFWILAAMAGAAQTLPSLEYGHLAVRWVGAPDVVGWNQVVPYDVHHTFSLHPASLLGVVVPGLRTHPEPYLGPIICTLALIGLALAWRRRGTALMAAIAAGGLLYSMAPNGLLHGPLYALVPMVEKARSPSAATCLFCLGAAMLAALGTDTLLAGRPGRWRYYATGGSLLFGAAVVMDRLVRGNHFDDRILRIALCACLLGALLLVRHRLAAMAVLALALVDLSNVTAAAWPTRDNTVRMATLTALGAHSDIAAFLRQQPGLPRVDVDGDVIAYNFGDWYGLPQAGGYLASLTENVHAQDAYSPHMRHLLGIGFAVRTAPNEFYQEEVYRSPAGLKVYRHPDVQRRVFSIHQTMQVPAADMQAQIYVHRDELTSTVLLATSPPPLQRCAATDDVRLNAYTASRVSIRADMACAGMVILTDTWYPGWEAHIDGRPAVIHEAYGMVRGVVVPAGLHELEFRYRPWSVLLGMVLTLAAALVALAAKSASLH